MIRTLPDPDTVSTRRSIRRPAAVILALLIGAVAQPATAQADTDKAAAAWTVAASRDGRGCFATRRYDGPGDTTLLLGLDPDGANHLTVVNDNWSITPRQALMLEFRLTRGGYGDHPAVGIEADGKRGFVATFEPRFPDHIAASRRLDIYRGTTPVARLDLTGSGAAVARLRRCSTARTSATPGAQTPSDVPIDPFAPDSPRGKKR